jgi:hypothetical protein
VETELPPEPSPEPQPVAQEPMQAAAEIPAAIAAPAAVVPPAPEVPSYRDRGSLLVFFGVIQIILGLLAALMVPLAALGAFMSHFAPGGGMRPGQFISGVAVYALIAIALLCLGIGSIQAKRWAWALTLVTSWYWLVSGVLGTVLLTAVLPLFMRAALQAQRNAAGTPSPEISTGVMAVILTILIVIAAFFLIAVPIALIVVYSRRDVAETCRHRDPVERWTDRVPLPVLGASVVLATHAVAMLFTGFGTPLFPFFGRHLYGVTAMGCFVLVAVLDAYLSVAFYRLQSTGWWIAAIITPIRLLSMALTYIRTDLMDAYSKMGMSEEQLRMLNSSPISHSHATLWWNLLSVVILYGYLLWLKRYFRSPSNQLPGELPVRSDEPRLLAGSPEPRI